MNGLPLFVIFLLCALPAGRPEDARHDESPLLALSPIDGRATRRGANVYNMHARDRRHEKGQVEREREREY